MIWQNFQRPANAQPEEEGHSSTFARFLAQPFERGWGTTLGNSLRRALLSSIPSAAITAVKIEGADHEFSAVPGVVEDVTDIILNLKKIPFAVHGQEPAILTLEAKGPGEVTAGQFVGSHQVEVIDPDVHVDACLAQPGDAGAGDLRVRILDADEDGPDRGLRRERRAVDEEEIRVLADVQRADPVMDAQDARVLFRRRDELRTPQLCLGQLRDSRVRLVQQSLQRRHCRGQ